MSNAPARTNAPRNAWTDRRHHRRAHVVWSGCLRSGRAERDCVILDVSVSGAMIRLDDAAASRAHVVVSTPRLGALTGRVVWQQDNVVGLAFTARPHRVVHTIARAAPGLRLAS